MCLKFAQKCIKREKTKHFFQRDKQLHKMNKRSKNIFKNKQIKTSRFEQSAIPYMTRLLNNERKKSKIIEEFT